MDVEFVCLADFQRTDGRADDLVALSLWLAQVPCGPLYDRRISPDYSTMRQLGGAFGVFARTGGYASAQQFTDGFAPAMGACAALALTGAAAGLTLRSRTACPPPPRQRQAPLST